MGKMDRDHLQIKLKSLLLDIFGLDSYEIGFDEDLRKRQSWNSNDEEKFQEYILNEFAKRIDLSKINPLTLDNIVTFLQGKEEKGGVV